MSAPGPRQAIEETLYASKEKGCLVQFFKSLESKTGSAT